MSAAFALHGICVSGPTYKVSLFLSLAGVPFDFVYGVLDYAAAGGIELKPYPKVRAFMKRIQAPAGFGSPMDIIPKASRTL